MRRAFKAVGVAVLLFWGTVALVLALAGAAHATTTTTAAPTTTTTVTTTTTTTTTLHANVHTDDLDVLQTCAGSCTTGSGPTGQSGDKDIAVFQVNGSAAVIVQFGFTGTEAGEVDNSIDGGRTWTLVTGASFTATTSSPQKFAITDPVGWYKPVVSTCTGCTYTTRYQAAPRGLH